MSEFEIPSEEEIAKLPRLAQVAFASRCARRVQPLFSHAWPDAPPEHVEAVDRAITLTQASAANPASVSESDLWAASDAISTAIAATEAASSTIAVAAADSAALAIYLAREIFNANLHYYKLEDSASRVEVTTASVAFAAVNAAVVAYRACLAITEAIHHDFDLLLAISEREEWTVETSVPPEVFGPMWPDGEPEGWPEDHSRTPQPFSFVLDPGNADRDTLQEVLSALSDLHEAHTGYALTYEIEGSIVHAYAEELT